MTVNFQSHPYDLKICDCRRRELDEEEEARKNKASAIEEPLPFFAEEFPRITVDEQAQAIPAEPEPPYPIYDEEKRIKREKAAEIARRRELDEEEEARKNKASAIEEPLPFFAEEFPRITVDEQAQAIPAEPEPPFPIYDEVPEEMRKNKRTKSERRQGEKKAPEIQLPEKKQTQKKPSEKKLPETQQSERKTAEKKTLEIQPPKPKVIKKNAAAISAYGKAAGAPVLTAPQADILLPREENPLFYSDENPPELEPFKDIGSIFDVLEQSENGDVRSAEPITPENAPQGFWTEEREPYTEPAAPEPPEPSELDMLKSKKNNKSNKTRRLYDVIMREPDDNPNVRKKGK